MKNTLHTIPVPTAVKGCERKPWVLLFIITAFLLFSFLPAISYAQNCNISNNTITCKAPVCDNTKAYIEGSQARAAGSVTYQWQINTHDNSPNGFEDIPGATGEDYSVPQTADGKAWYRRVAIYGNCRVPSDRLSIANCTNQQIALPSARIVQPTCSVPTGTMTILVPETAVRFSIDGGASYSTTRVFENLQPGTYSIRVEYTGGCLSPIVPITINTPPSAPVGQLSPEGAVVICEGSSQVLTATGGTSYQWRLNGNAIAGATSATYTATSAGEYSVIITKDGCSAPATNTATLTVAAKPVLVISNPAASCSPVDLTASAVTAGSESGLSLSYWTDAGATSPLNNPNAVTASGTYYIKGVNASNCTTIVPVKVTITPPPSGNITPTNAAVCANGGTVVLSANGGTSYQWYKDGVAISGAEGATYTASQPGTYTVDIINGECKGTARNAAVISEAPAPSGAISPAIASLCKDETLELTVSGGTSYQWYKDGVAINGGTQSKLTVTEPGTYAADIINGDCKGKAENEVVIANAPLPTGSINPSNESICSTQATTITVTGGSSYQWYKNNVAISGATEAVLSVREAGTYTADIINSNGCKAKASNASVITITPTPSGIISPSSLTVCNGGTGRLSVSGGDTYQWYRDGDAIGGATTAELTVELPGTYTVDIIKDNCTGKATNSATVSVGASLTGSIQPASAVICNNGSVVLTAEGGAAYQWYKDGVLITGATNATYTATAPGNYTVDLINGDCKGKASNNAVVTMGATPSGTITPATVAICDNGSTILTVSGGTSYQWYRNGTIINGATAATYTASQPGTYTADIISGTCKGNASNNAIVSIATPPTGSISPAAANICNGASVALSVSGGSTYQWYRNGVLIADATTANYIAEEPGIYTVDIINDQGCKGKSTNEATISSSPVTSSPITPAAVELCPGGAATVSTSGGTTYQWYKDGVAIPGATQDTYTITAPGKYTADIINGSCKVKTSNEVEARLLSAPTGSVSPANPSICSGTTATLTITGGTTYQWYKDGVAINGATAGTLSVSEAGTYTADIISENGCKGKSSNESKVTITPAPAGSLSPEVLTICNGGSGTLTASGGTSYQWYKDGNLITGATAATYNVTQPGTYTADIINGECKGKANNSVFVSLGDTPTGGIQPATGVLCTNGSIILRATGGNSYQWYKDGVLISGATNSTYTATEPGSYSVDLISGTCIGKASNNAVISAGNVPVGVISPSNATICPNGGTTKLSVTGGTSYQWYRDGLPIGGATAATLTATQPGTYTADIINGDCKGKTSNSATITQAVPPSGTISPATSDLCSNASVTLTATGGATYQWYKNRTLISGATAATYTATTAGVYTVDIISAEGCRGEAGNSAEVTGGEPPVGSISPAIVSLCPGGAVTATATGGTSYQWYKDGIAIPGATQSNYNITAAGTYTADIINGECKGKATNNVIATVSNVLEGSISPASVTLCTGGSATLTVTGGSSYQWYKDGVLIAGATNATIVVKEPGSYTADIISGSCKGKASNTSVVSVGAAPTGTISPASLTICSSGSGTLTATGGTSYQWYRNGAAITGAVDAIYEATQDGTYSVDIINGDCKGKASNSAIVTMGTQITGTIKPAAAELCNGTSFTLTAEGGSSYQWYRDAVAINGATGATLSVTQPGTYSVDIISNNGCIGKASNESVVTVTNVPNGRITPATLTICSGGSGTLTASGGTSYQWYRNGVAISGAITATYNANQAGTYAVDIINGSCKGKASNEAVVTVGTSLSGTISPAAGVLCNNGSIALTATGGSSYQWYKDGVAISGATGATYNATSVGNYTADIISGDCKAKASNNAVITAGNTPTGQISPASISLCSGGNAVLTITGGTSYQWYKDGVAINGATAASYTVTTIGTYTADIINGDCKGKASNAAVVTQAASPSGAITPAIASLCGAAPVVLTVSGGDTYQWYRNGVAINGASSSTYSVTQAGTYSADILASGGCKSRSSNEVVVAASGDPSGTISPAAVSLCSGGAVTVTATGGTSYQWYKDGVAITGATQNTYSITAAGTYTADIINGECKGKASNSVVATISNSPSGTIFPASVSICSGGNATLTVTGGSSYQWYKDGVLINGATNATLEVKEAGSYTADILSGSCKGKASNAAIVSLGAAPSGAISPASLTICTGGSGELRASGGTTYQWYRNGTAITGATAAVYIASEAGTYSVDIINGDCKGKASNSALVTIGEQITGAITPAKGALCDGASLILTAEGGSSYQWYKEGVAINGATAATYNATAVGTYSADIISGSCKAKASNTAVITSGVAPTGTISPANVNSCSAEPTVLTATGGTSYQWYKDGAAITGATTATLSVTQSGTYSVDIFSDSGCKGKASNESKVTIAPTLSGAISPSTLTVCNGASGVLTATGGTSYQWYRNGTAITGAVSGTYTVTQEGTYTVDIISGTCKVKASNEAVVTAGSNLSGTISPASAVLCNGGSVLLTAEGGSSYQWYKDGQPITGATGNTYTATLTGTYTVDLISGSCKAQATNNAVVTAGNAPVGQISPASIPLCLGGNAVLTVTGGTSYQWYKDGVAIPGATTASYTVTSLGIYSADIINGDCKGKASNTAIVTVGIAPVGSITPATVNICNNGAATLTADGGSSYQWYKDGVAIPNATSATYSATQSGTYSADIISLTGCKSKATNESVVSITGAPTGDITPASLTICSGGTGSLKASGGTSYQWYRNGTLITGAIAESYSVTQAGTYTVDIINGDCKAKASNEAVVTIGTSLSGTISPSAGVLCSNGSVVLTATGGSSYQWLKDGQPISGATASTYTVTSAGTYTVELISGSCKGMAANNVIITAGNAPAGSISPASVSLCTGSSTVLSVTGGTSYEWYKDGVIINGATAASYTASAAGTYTADIINGDCKGKASNSAIVTQSSSPSGSITPATAGLCGSTPVVLTVSGGETYQWYRDGVAINGATDATYNVTEAGVYSADIIARGGCKGKSSNEVNVTANGGPSGAITPAAVSLCSGGAVVVTATGGTTYQWYKDGVAITGATQNIYSITAAGTYMADIINGECKGKATNNVVATLTDKPTGSITPTTASICGGNAAALTATGGSLYQWFKDGIAISGATAATYNATVPGQYTVTIINGSCSGPASNTVTVSAGTAITFNTTIADISCAVSSGTITINTVTGGSGTGYQYSKDNGATFQSESTFTGLPAGQYQIVVKDDAGCKSAPISVTVKQSANTINVAATTTDIACGQSTGTVTINVTNGQAPYTYSLDGAAAQTSNVFENLTAGTYKVLVKDAVGCSKDVSFTIKQINSTLTATPTVTNPTCGESTGAVSITANGGTPDYQFSLDNGAFQASQSFSNVAIGKHTVIVKDKAGCIYEVPFEVKASSGAPQLVVTNPAPVCPGSTTNLKAAAVTAGSDAGITLSYWTNADATTTLANPDAVGAGTYYIKAVNAAGCFTIKPVVVTSSTTSAGAISPANPAVVCSGESVTLTATNGVSYQWLKDDVVIAGSTNVTYQVTQEGRYSVMINNGTCTVLAGNVVTVKFQTCTPARETKVFVPTAFTPNRNGENDLLQPYFLNIRQLVQFKVFNRWGQQVYQTNVIGQGWDGTLKGVSQPADTYSWVLECIDFDGKTIKQSGRSLLIR
jgi:gliding motility-associated-like protein